MNEKKYPVKWVTAESITLPEVDATLPNIAVFPTHEKVLRTLCMDVNEETARSDEFRIHVANMLCGIYNTNAPAIGIASNQLGLPMKVIAVDTEWPKTNNISPKVLLNPVVLNKEGTQDSMEGCLSIPLNYHNIVKRPKTVTIGAVTLDWEPITFDAVDLEAAALVHEIDHLHGVLFIDHLSRLKKSMYFRKLIKYARRHHHEQQRLMV
jgi:peptide deformylase